MICKLLFQLQVFDLYVWLEISFWLLNVLVVLFWVDEDVGLNCSEVLGFECFSFGLVTVEGWWCLEVDGSWNAF